MGYTVTYKAALLNREDAKEVQDFNDLLKEHTRLITGGPKEVPEEEIKKKSALMDEFTAFKKKHIIRNFEEAK